MSVAANATAASARWTPGIVTSAAMPNRTSALSAGTSRRGCAMRAATTSATSGGNASAARTRCAAPSDAAPLITASRTEADAKSAVRCSHAPGLRTLDPPAHVTQRPRARDVRNALEVPRRRRRRGVPLERVGEPRVVGGARTLARRLDDVDEEQQEADRHHTRTDRREEVVRLRQAVLAVGEVTTRHAHQAEHVLREEREVETDEHEPELGLTQSLVQYSPEELRPPVEQRGEEPEHGPSEKRVVHVRNDEVRVRHLPVEWEHRKEDPRQAADREDRDEAERPEHRRVEDEIAAPGRREPVEDLHAGRNGDHHRREHEEDVEEVRQPDAEHVVRPDEHRIEADRDGRERDRLVAEDRLAREDGNDLGDHAHRRQDDDVDLGMAEEPEQVLVEEGVSTLLR